MICIRSKFHLEVCSVPTRVNQVSQITLSQVTDVTFPKGRLSNFNRTQLTSDAPLHPICTPDCLQQLPSLPRVLTASILWTPIDYSTTGDMGESSTAVDAVASGLQGEFGMTTPRCPRQDGLMRLVWGYRFSTQHTDPEKRKSKSYLIFYRC